MEQACGIRRKVVLMCRRCGIRQERPNFTPQVHLLPIQVACVSVRFTLTRIGLIQLQFNSNGPSRKGVMLQ